MAATSSGPTGLSTTSKPASSSCASTAASRKRRAFDLPVDLRGQPTFAVSVLGELAKVPYGHTQTYGELATRAGNPKAARAVGMVMNRNPLPIVLPCHRIVGASGGLVGYGGGLERKEHLLRLEGAIL